MIHSNARTNFICPRAGHLAHEGRVTTTEQRVPGYQSRSEDVFTIITFTLNFENIELNSDNNCNVNVICYHWLTGVVLCMALYTSSGPSSSHFLSRPCSNCALVTWDSFSLFHLCVYVILRNKHHSWFRKKVVVSRRQQRPYKTK